ncbi:MAG: hypothetical protein ACI4XS_03620 [Bacillus sp. (in: firmicutes)]
MSAPIPRMSNYNPNFGDMVVDIKVNVEGNSTEYKQVPSNLNTANFGSVIISDSRDDILREVDKIANNSRHILDSIEQHEKIIESCDGIAKRLNPSIAKDIKRDELISGLQSEMSEIKQSLNELLKYHKPVV